MPVDDFTFVKPTGVKEITRYDSGNAALPIDFPRVLTMDSKLRVDDLVVDLAATGAGVVVDGVAIPLSSIGDEAPSGANPVIYGKSCGVISFPAYKLPDFDTYIFFGSISPIVLGALNLMVLVGSGC